jgi:hypothetical protein
MIHNFRIRVFRAVTQQIKALDDELSGSRLYRGVGRIVLAPHGVALPLRTKGRVLSGWPVIRPRLLANLPSPRRLAL